MRSRLPDLVRDSAQRHGDAPAVTYGDVTLSYAQLWRSIERAAAGLARLGLRRHDRVAVYLDKRIETVVAIFGAAHVGGVFVPINPLLRPKQVSHILSDCGVRVLITTPERLHTLDADAGGLKVDQVVLVGDDADPTATRWDALVAGEEPPVASAAIDMDMAAILYTSGSTGLPKGVVLSHRNLIVGAESVSTYLGNNADDVILAALPLSFDAGLSQLTTAFAVGAHVVLMNYLLAKDVVRLCAQHRVTGLTCVPPLWLQVADQTWPAEATQHLRYFANTGGRMPRATLEKLRSIFPAAKPYLMYGLTEAFRSTYLEPAEVDRRPDSIGKAIPNAEILVVRPDGTECAPGEEGELVHRGALVSMGYWNDPVRTAERFKPAPARPDGLCLPEPAVWSGDVVIRDEEGFLYFVGRNDEMIKVSGYRISPTEIEEAVYDTGLVRDVVALGVDDPRIGQHIVLMVTPAMADFAAATLLNELKRELPRYMVPQDVVVRAELPRSPNGKFDRALIRQELTSS
jgi:acyl-CoA ligase (AMP-forming) (exosortase A-associated)